VRVPEWLRQRGAISPDRLALRCGGVGLTFSELETRVDAVARGLLAQGLEPGDRVGVVASSGLDTVLLVHAVPRVGAVLVPLSARATETEVAAQAADAGVRTVLREAPEAPGAAAGVDGFELDAVHSVVYTSGTSGCPKGVVLTFGNHLWSALGSALTLGHAADDRWLACMPLHHVGGLAILLRSVICGAGVVLHDRFEPERVLAEVEHGGVTHVSLVPTMLHRLLAACGGGSFPPGLRCALVGGGPLPPTLLEAAVAAGVPVAPTYGLTEAASQVATLPPGETASGAVRARPLPFTEVRIAGDPPPGAAGEILVRGPTVTPGYWGRPGETAAALADGWLHTGDVGFLDGGGWLHVLDRRDDLIVTGGENVAPAEVEAVLRSHPGVEDAGVVGLPDPEWGQRVAAAVVLEPGAGPSDAELAAFCHTLLSGIKAPTVWRRVAALPRTESGKLTRSNLLELFGFPP